jgi:hypothetical protein
MKLAPTTEKVSVKWFVWAQGEKLPKKSGMLGYKGFDAQCSCGYETRTGGGVYSWVKEDIETHKLLEHGYEWLVKGIDY